MQLLASKKYHQVSHIRNFKELCNYVYAKHQNLTAYKFKLDPKGEVISKTFADFYEDVQATGLACFKFLRELNKHSEIDWEKVHYPKFAIWGSNSYAWRVSYMGSACNEGLVVPLDKLLKYGEFKGLMDRAKPEVLFYGGSFHEHIKRLVTETDYLKLAICINEEQLGKTQSQEDFITTEEYFRNMQTFSGKTQFLKNEDFIRYGYDLQKQVALYRAYQMYEKSPQAPSLLLFTSGTTEMSKGIVLSQENICFDMCSTAEVIKLEPGMTTISLLPLHHTFENTGGFLMMLYYGCCVCDNDGLRYIADNFKEYKPDMMIAVPLMFNHFYNRIQQAVIKKNAEEKLKKGIAISNGLRKVGVDLRRKFFKDILEQLGGNLRLGISGAAPSSVEVLNFFDSIGVRIIEGYGLTETAPICTGCNFHVFEPGTTGHAFGDIEVAIDNQKDGESGEILVRGKNVMLGYWKSDEEFDRSSIDENGWFHTGDLGQIVGPQKCLKIVGRLKSMIVLESGKKVFPEEVEDLLKAPDFVKEAMLWGETQADGSVLLALELSLDKDLLKEELKENFSEKEINRRVLDLVDRVNKSMPHYKHIRYVFYNFEDMIKTTTLKVKRVLEQEAVQVALISQAKELKDVHGGYFSKNSDVFPL